MRNILAPLLVFLLGQMPSLAALTFTIDKTTEQVDWVNGFSITKTTGIDNNNFGTNLADDLVLSSPLSSYSGNGSHFQVNFDLSPDLTRIQGMRLFTTVPPGNPASFSGTPEGPATPTFSLGSFSLFAGLNYGDYTLSPVGAWSDGIRVLVVPEPAAPLLCVLGLVIVIISRAYYRRAYR